MNDDIKNLIENKIGQVIDDDVYWNTIMNFIYCGVCPADVADELLMYFDTHISSAMSEKTKQYLLDSSRGFRRN